MIPTSSKKKIVILSAFYEPFMSGAEQMAKEILERLGGKYHLVLVTARLDKSLPKEESRPGFHISRVGVGHKLIDKFLYPLLAAWRVRKERPEIVQSIMESYAGGALVIVKMLWPYATRILSLQSGDLDHGHKQSRWLVRSFWNLIHRSPHLLTPISGFLADRAKRLGVSEDKIRIVPNGVDLSDIGQGVAKQPNTVACVARLSWEKGLDYLVKAWPDVVKEIPDAKLELIGEGDKRPEIERLASELGISDSVTLRGNLPHGKVLQELAKTEIFVCPSLAEGLGIVFIEAQACGCAVIGTNVGGIPDVINDEVNGLLIPPQDASAISLAIIRLLKDKSLAKDLVVAGLESVKKFDWQSIISEIEKIYDGYLERKPRLLIATGIYPPQLGGPATFSHALAHGMVGKGYHVDVLTFGDSRASGGGPQMHHVGNAGNPLARYLHYFFRLWKLSSEADIVYALDITSVGLPAALVRMLRPRLKLVYRLGGDFQWEKALVEGRYFGTLRQYYADKRFGLKERFLYLLTSLAIKAADVLVFNSDFLADIYVKDRKIGRDKVVLIKNIRIDGLSAPQAGNRDDGQADMVFAGRLVVVKNLPNLLKAMAIIKDGRPDVYEKINLELIGEGPQKDELASLITSSSLNGKVKLSGKLSHADLMGRIAVCDIIINVSLSEVNPNLIAEALTLNKKVVITKESEPFYSDLDSDSMFFVNPLGVDEIARGIISCFESHPSNEAAREELSKIAWDKEKVIRSHTDIFEKLTHSDGKA